VNCIPIIILLKLIPSVRINAKLGGINYTPRTRMMNVVSEMPTMIIGKRSRLWMRISSNISSGADVSHPSPGSSTPSIASLVASFDPQASMYPASSVLSYFSTIA